MVLGMLLWGMAPTVQSKAKTKYLIFQIFTYTYSPKGKAQAFDKKSIQKTIDTIIQALSGEHGDGSTRQLGFAVGPMVLDQTDNQLREMILESFNIALEKNVAVVFHIDDSMFWKRRKDLWKNHNNIEWMDWKGTPNTGRKIAWGKPLKLAPQMCFNSKEIQAEVKRLVREVIGIEIKKGVDKLKNIGKEVLFAGVIAGWETQIGEDFDSDKPLGYCALTNRGFNAKKPPKDLDREREKIVQDFIDLWTKELSNAGVNKEKIYSHIAFLPKKLFEQLKKGDARFRSKTYSEWVHFAPPSVGFGEYHNPAFSTYPAPRLFEQIYDELKKHGNPSWASSEGTNLVIGGKPGESGMSMEGYLAKMFNHGATLVNIFAWGVGVDGGRNNPFRIATEGEQALSAYRKFLKGEELREETSSTIVSPDNLAIKIH